MQTLSRDFINSSLSSCKHVSTSRIESWEGVEIDSRKQPKNKVFFAIQGTRFDGHDFLSSALDQGAKAFVVSDLEKARFLLKEKHVNLFLVPDTLKALTELAKAWRKKLELKVLAITGSSGKTSVSSFTKTLLADLSPFASPNSYNNAIGLSLSLLRVHKKGAVLIQELGTNTPGEIAFLTDLCQPDLSVVNMVGASHLEGLKSLEGIAQEKKHIYTNSPQAVWVFNKDNPWTQSMAEEFYKQRGESSLKKKQTLRSLSSTKKKQTLWSLSSTKKKQTLWSFSSTKTNVDVSFKIKQQDKEGLRIEGQIAGFPSTAQVPLFGKESVENLMCASTIALAMGVSPERIWEKLPECRSPKGRQQIFFLKEKAISICFDAYNANPSSMDFFLRMCETSALGTHRFLILGDMKELGVQSENYHKKLASHKIILDSRVLFFIGEKADLIEKELQKNQYQGIFKAFKAYHKELHLSVKKEWKKKDFIGLKASRSLALERLFFDLTGVDIF